ncbi:MAG TPA: ABC transporter permease [Candidatus Polarisedimenticolia bacterium]|nr:ABC transporter permease [Candidatus Polarisedimenticolia bacterium]
MGEFLSDLKYGWRALRAKPGFAFAAIVALALGIGANSAIFSIVHTVLIQPLPYKAPERLAMIWHEYRDMNLPQATISVPTYLEYRDHVDAFESVAAGTNYSANLTGSGEPERVQGARVTYNFLKTIGVAPAQGRDFLPEEDVPGSERVVILNHGLWQRRFGADPSIVGKEISLNGETHTVVGILPAGFMFFRPVDLYKPIAFTAEQKDPSNHGFEYLIGVARIKEGVSIAQARASLAASVEGLRKYYDKGWGAFMRPLLEEVAGDTRPMLYVLLAAVGCLLLIACANVANLLLARGTSRQKEMALRAALGARRGRIVRQLLAESLLLGLIGGVAGLLVAVWGLKILLAAVPQQQLQQALAGRTIGLDASMLFFTFVVSIGTGLVFGLVPAIVAASPNLAGMLKEGGRESSGGRHRVLGGFVIAQVAIAMVLLVGAGLLVRSLDRLRQVDPGFKADNLLTMRLFLPNSRYTDDTQVAGFFDNVMPRLRALPGVVSAGAISNLPMGGDNASGSYEVEGRPVPEDQAGPHGDSHYVTSDYFETMKIPLVKGRFIEARDSAEATQVIVIDQELANHIFPNEDPIGHRLAKAGEQDGEQPRWRTIVGVVGHVAKYALDGRVKEQYYIPQAQRPQRSMWVAVRTAGDPHAIVSAANGAVRAVDPDMPLFQVNPMTTVVENTLMARKFLVLLLMLFAAVALTLAAVGLYGVIAYAVGQRTHEIGIRMALGARVGDVVTMVVRQGMGLALIGLAVGAVAAFATTRFIASLLFGVGAADPVTFVVIPAILASVALVASWIPARRAARVDPMAALRDE